jgi:hypothetical protein
VNVITVGLLSIAVYAVVVVLWLRHDKNEDSYTTRKEDRS